MSVPVAPGEQNRHLQQCICTTTWVKRFLGLSAPGSEKLEWELNMGLPTNLLERKKAHKHKQISGIVPGLGGWQKFVYHIKLCVFFWGGGVIPYGGEKHINKFPPKSRDNPMEYLFTCFFLSVFFLLPKVSVLDSLWMFLLGQEASGSFLKVRQ